MKSEITEKLGKFLDDPDQLRGESEAVYLLIELRKLLDHEKSDGFDISKYSLLYFYANWAVHTDLDRNTQIFGELLKEVTPSINASLDKGDLSYLSMKGLRESMRNLFNSFGLPLFKIENEGLWKDFVTSLVSVLANQPIINPTSAIAKFYYLPSKDPVLATINFSDGNSSITIGVDGELLPLKERLESLN